jgi:hypothetical protein
MGGMPTNPFVRQQVYRAQSMVTWALMASVGVSVLIAVAVALLMVWI